jgi:hypothetical protein
LFATRSHNKSISIPQPYRHVLAIAAVILFFSGLPLFLSELELLAVRPVIWVIVYGLLAIPIVLASAQDCIKHNLLILIWSGAFACISLGWFIIGSQSDEAFEALRYRVITVTTLLFVMFTTMNTTSLVWARWAVAIWSLFSVCLNIYDLLNPFTVSGFPGRASGVYLNPNLSAEALVLGMLLCVSLFSPVRRTWFVMLIGIGVVTTFSRAGLLAYAVGVVGLIFSRLIPARSFLMTVCSAALVATIAIATQNWDTFIAGWDQEGVVTSTEIVKVIEERLTWFSDPGTSDAAMTERVEGANQAWRLFTDQPFVGGGTGTNFDMWVISDEFRNPGPHNIYLWLIVDHGIIGAFIFPALLLSVGWRATGESRKLGIIMGAILFFLGFSSHNLLDSRHVLFSLGALSAMVAQDKIPRERLWRNHREQRGALGNTPSYVSA